MTTPRTGPLTPLPLPPRRLTETAPAEEPPDQEPAGEPYTDVLSSEDIRRVNDFASALIDATLEGDRPSNADPLDVVMDHRKEIAKGLKCAPTFSAIMTAFAALVSSAELDDALQEEAASERRRPARRAVSTAQTEARGFLLKNGIVPRSMRRG